MAFKVSDYGNGELGDVSNVSGTINSYARVTAISGSTVTINADTQTEGAATFKVGAKVLLHVSAAASTAKAYLGKYLLANITAISNNVFTLDENVATKLMASSVLASYYVQIIAVAQYKSLSIGNGITITPPVYSTSSYHGGIVAIMCSDGLYFNGGHISLTDRGIPVASSSLRPLFSQETNGTDDIQQYSGWENDCSRYFPLNCGDGAAFIITKYMGCNTNSRIGNISTYGVQFYRGATSSVTYSESAPSSVTNVGGSSIFIAAETIANFTPRMIAKYRSSSSTKGAGICRCYIASETKLRNDEGLYAYDCISTPIRLMRDMNIKNFGDGNFGDLNNLTTQMNNYATVTAISGAKVTYKNKTTTGLAQISAGAMVMIHWNHKGNSYVIDAGRFIIAKVLSDTGSVLTLDTTPPNISVSNYACQIVSIPQCNNYTLSTTNSATVAYNGAQGGIFAIAVKNTCDIKGGNINVSAKGGGSAYARAGLAYIGNAQDSNKLPIGQGHGSVFILANKILMNTGTRIGYGSGAGICSYRGTKSNDHSTKHDYCGSGAKVYETTSTTIWTGGYGSNAQSHANYTTSIYKYQGAHIMIVADTIDGFNQLAIGTGGGSDQGAGYGGMGRTGSSSYTYYYSGYNGGSASNGSIAGGGSSGWAFVYCNNPTNQNTSYTIYEG